MVSLTQVADAPSTPFSRPSWTVVEIAGERADVAPSPVLVSTDDRPTDWRPHQRLHHLVQHRCDLLGASARAHIAVDAGDHTHTYDELMRGSTRLARMLAAGGVAPGTRVASLLDRSVRAHTSVLALSMLGATYVPLDASFPTDRVRFMLGDAEVTVVVTLRCFAARFEGAGITVVVLDELDHELDAQSDEPIEGTSVDPDPVSYIIYTSGSTGMPKGVPIRQSSLCNFLHVAASAYGYRDDDRVYQGLTFAFDFSVEEVWVPLVVGATLVTAPSDTTLIGDDLAAFLRSPAASQRSAACRRCSRP